MLAASPPTVMTFSACDPTGGAGLQADLMALVSVGCHAANVVTGITVQDTAGVDEFVAVEADRIDDQARTVLEDMPIAGFKIGVLGDVETVAAVAGILSDYPDLPVVLDPVLASGRGDPFMDDDTISALRQLLLPQTTLVTPNSYEARRLASGDDDDDAARELALDAAAAKLLSFGVEYVLVTGTHEATADVVNTLYGGDASRKIRSDVWPRLAGSFHGSGCTLASAIAGLLASGASVEDAVRRAQDYAWRTLDAAFRPGMGQALPDRFFWARAITDAMRRPSEARAA